MIRKVRTENGILLGLPGVNPRITVYKGIPYAAPPIGENRWKAPRPCRDWAGEKTAYEFAPIAMQASIKGDPASLYDREWHVDTTLPMSEDCLYLNVWCPAGEDTKDCPVFVWFHGGGFQVGYTAEMEFNGERLAKRGLIVVTVAYRLNVFGFLCHPEITEENPETPANFGYLDQQFALRWVQRNISAFGGNPDNVTIGGQSAGGTSVCAQMIQPENRGLFHKVIIESGTFCPCYAPPPVRSFAEDEQDGIAFFEMAGVQTLAEARKLDAVTLRDTLMRWESRHGWANAFTEALDGRFIRRRSMEWFTDPNWLRLPVLMGNTDAEFMEFPPAKNRKELSALAESFGPDREAFLSCFGEPYTEESIREEGKQCSIAFSQQLAATVNPKGPRLYSYCFRADIPGCDKPCAFHSVDLWFFFETLSLCWRPFTGVHYDLARQMCDYWANFIKTGDPNGLGSDGKRLPDWQAYEPTRRSRMFFDDVSHSMDEPLTPLQQILQRRLMRNHSI